jgi:uncharacterized protein YodC (DUF2158 family)
MGEMIFEVGATVKLASGGPLMTIVRGGLAADGKRTLWVCMWFNGATACTEEVDERALIREEPKAVP